MMVTRPPSINAAHSRCVSKQMFVVVVAARDTMSFGTRLIR